MLYPKKCPKCGKALIARHGYLGGHGYVWTYDCDDCNAWFWPCQVGA